VYQNTQPFFSIGLCRQFRLIFSGSSTTTDSGRRCSAPAPPPTIGYFGLYGIECAVRAARPLLSNANSDVRIVNNRITNPKGQGVFQNGSGAARLEIVGNMIRGAYALGVATGSGNTEVMIADNMIEGCGLALSGWGGIDFGSCTDVTVTGNTVRNCSAGIVGDGCSRVTIAGNVVYHIPRGGGDLNGGDGISIGGVGGTSPRGITIVGNTVRDTGRYSIFLGSSAADIHGAVIQGNVLENAGTEADAAAVRLDNSAEVVISGNQMYDTQATKTTTYAVQSVNTSDRALIVGNIMRAGRLKTGTTSLVGANNVTANNITT
jgi:parallel beta-helix repeat protein